MIADDLAGQPHSRQPSLLETLFLGGRHCLRLAVDEFDAACRAPRVASARVKNVNFRVLLDREHEALVITDVKRSVTFNCQFGHGTFYRLVGG